MSFLFWLLFTITLVLLMSYLYMALTAVLTEISFAQQAKKLPKYPYKQLPSVSVILSACNEQKNLPRFLDHILAQTYQPLEILLMDNLSSDKTGEIMQQYQERFPDKIKVFSGEPAPPNYNPKCFAINKLVEKSSGEIVLQLDADDILAPQAIEHILSYMVYYDLDLLSGYPFFLLQSMADHLLAPFYVLLSHAVLAIPFWKKFGYNMAVGMLIASKRSALQASQGYGHPEVMSSLTDDVALARLFRKKHYKTMLVSLTSAKTGYALELFDNFPQAIKSFSRSIFYATSSGKISLFICNFILATLMASLPIILILSLCLGFNHLAWFALAILLLEYVFWGFIYFMRRFYSWSILLSPFSFFIILFIGLKIMFIVATGKGFAWKNVIHYQQEKK